MSSQFSPFRNKTLVPTLFAHSNEFHKYLPVEPKPTAQEKVREKKRQELHNDILTMLQRRDDKNKQTLVNSMREVNRVFERTPVKTMKNNVGGSANGGNYGNKSRSKSNLRLSLKSKHSLFLQTPNIESLLEESPQTAFDYLLQVQQVQKAKLADLKQKLLKKGINPLSQQQKKKQQLQKQFTTYQNIIDRDFNITTIDILKAEQQKAEKAKQYREFIEKSRLSKQKDLKSRHKRQSKGFLFTKAPQELRRPKSISELQPLIGKIEGFYRAAGQSLRKFEEKFKEMEEVQTEFKMRPLVEDQKGVIDYLNEYRNKQIQMNREMFPLTV